MDKRGVEPRCTCLQGMALNPSDKPVVEPEGIEPSSLPCQRSVLPLNDGPLVLALSPTALTFGGETPYYCGSLRAEGGATGNRTPISAVRKQCSPY